MDEINHTGNFNFTISSTTANFKSAGKSIPEIIDICKKSGSAGIEGGAPFFAGKKITELEKIKEQFEKENLVIATFHLPFKNNATDDISALYETERLRVEDNMKEWIEKAYALGSKIGIIHPATRKGYDIRIEGTEDFARQADKTIKSLLKFSEQFDFKIAIENMHDRSMFGSDISHLTGLYNRNAHENLGFCMDTGHALISAGKNAIDIFHGLKDHLIAFHLADNAGDRDSHLAPGCGNFFWKEFFMEIKKINFKNTLCIETPPFDFGPDYSISSWKTLLDKTRELSEIS